MRAITLLLITVTAACCSCKKAPPPGAAFRYTEALKPAERATVEQQRTRWTLIGDGPAYRATWTNGGSVLHVHLTCNGIFSLSGPWPFGVFNDDGQLLEENMVLSGVDLVPKRLLNVSPVRVAFGHTNSTVLVETNEAKYTPDGWRAFIEQLNATYLKDRAREEAARAGARQNLK